MKKSQKDQVSKRGKPHILLTVSVTVKTNSENIDKWRMIYILDHRISILLNVQRKEENVDSRIIRTQRTIISIWGKAAVLDYHKLLS